MFVIWDNILGTMVIFIVSLFIGFNIEICGWLVLMLTCRISADLVVFHTNVAVSMLMLTLSFILLCPCLWLQYC